MLALVDNHINHANLPHDAWLSQPTSCMVSTSNRRKCSGFDNLKQMARIASLFSI
jgi:hypothetical protein